VSTLARRLCSDAHANSDYVQIFTLADLRLQLLEPEKFPYLYKCMYGILMLLPQSSAFAALKNRLNSVSSIGYLHVAPRRYVQFMKVSRMLYHPKVVWQTST
jgi:hypothetical protein